MNMRRGIPTEYGDGAIAATPRIVASLRAKRVLLVCGKRSFEASGAASMLPDLAQVAVVERWSDFSPNTNSVDLAKGLAVVRDFDPDLTLGIGGGSAMDMAKLLCAYDRTPDNELLATVAAAAPIASRRQRLILAPTTSGSGSQTTHFAVIYIGDDKYSIAGPAMYPDHIVLDPQLAISGSAHQRATSGIDAVCQAIESLWAAGATDESQRRARTALRFLLPTIGRFVDDPDPPSARAMSIGSHLAGQAIDVSKTTAAHALAYGITKRYGVDHGSAVALTLGSFIHAHDTADPDELQPAITARCHRDVMDLIRELLGTTHDCDGQRRFIALLQQIGLPTSLGEVGATDDVHLRELVGSVNVERLDNNPVRYDADALYLILKSSAVQA